MIVRGIKQQVFGGVLVGLCAVTALLSRMVGFELDIFYIVIGVVGTGLFLYGAAQRST